MSSPSDGYFYLKKYLSFANSEDADQMLRFAGVRSGSEMFDYVLSMDGWMDDLRFYVLFNSISVISGRCLDDNERLCAMELRLRLRRFHFE